MAKKVIWKVYTIGVGKYTAYQIYPSSYCGIGHMKSSFSGSYSECIEFLIRNHYTGSNEINSK